MRFQVPQFIETESKIIGPFTLKQFLYIAAGAVLVFLLNYALKSLFWWLVASLPIAGLAFALAFYRVDGIPLPRYILLAIGFNFGTKKYIFSKAEEDSTQIPGQ